MKSTVKGVLAALTLCCVSVACSDKVCTLIGCFNGLVISFREPLSVEDWLDIDMQLDDGRTLHCRWTRGDDVDHNECEDVDIEVLPNTIDERAIIQQLVLRLPRRKQVTLTIRSADKLLVDETLTPEYQEFEPNGPGCGTCDSANIELTGAS